MWTAKTSQTTPATTSTSPLRQLLGTADAQTAHPAQPQTNHWAPRTRQRTSRSTGRSGPQKAATRRNMRREERVTVQGPVKKQQPDGVKKTTRRSVTQGGGGSSCHCFGRSPVQLPRWPKLVAGRRKGQTCTNLVQPLRAKESIAGQGVQLSGVLKREAIPGFVLDQKKRFLRAALVDTQLMARIWVPLVASFGFRSLYQWLKPGHWGIISPEERKTPRARQCF